MIELDRTVPEGFAMFNLWAYMVHPQDEGKREQLLAYLLAKVAADASVPVPEFMIRPLIDAAGRGVSNDITDALAGGCLAGETLLTALQLRASGIEYPGIEKAQHLVSRAAYKWTNHKGARYRATPETLRTVHWRKYRTVAHLWGAYLIMIGDADANSQRDDVSAWFDAFRLAEIANGIRAYDGGTFLPNDALEVTGVGAAGITPPEMAGWVHAALQSYEPRRRKGVK